MTSNVIYISQLLIISYMYKYTHTHIYAYMGASQVALVVKNPPANAGDIRDMGSIPGSGRSPWKRTWQSTPLFLPGKFHGQRSLAGYSP